MDTNHEKKTEKESSVVLALFIYYYNIYWYLQLAIILMFSGLIF